MRRSIFFFLTVFLVSVKSFGQTNPSDKELMDSLLKNDEMLKMLNDFGKAESYFRINVGFGNKLYSDQNKAIESLQNNNPFIISPSVEYNNKSGLGISFTGFLFSENKKTDFYQYTLSPFYNYIKGKDVNLSFSYTHYFEKEKFSVNSSPVQDEFYGSILFKKGYIKPGIAAGYSSGDFHEVINIDTTVRVGTRQIRISYVDTTTTHISSFSFIANVEHSFELYKILSSKDGLIFTPQFSLVSGINTYKSTHSSSLSNYNAYTKKKLRRIRHFQSQSDNKFELQSFGLDLNLNYGIGKVYFAPDLYLNYYLPKTNDNRFTQIFNFNAGITF